MEVPEEVVPELVDEMNAMYASEGVSRHARAWNEQRYQVLYTLRIATYCILHSTSCTPLRRVILLTGNITNG